MERKRQLTPLGFQVEIEGGRVKLTFPGGAELLEVPKVVPKDISSTELTALTVMKLAIPLTFPKETTGVDQAGFQVERTDDIHSLPGGREEFYKDALVWAGSVLQARCWESKRVAELLMSDLPEQVKVGVQLGSISPDYYSLQKARLRKTIAGFYPGAAAAKERSRKRKIPDW